jgi:hypothetical protein
MAPDQTIRVMGNKVDIFEGQIQFFPTFPMEIFDRFEVFRLYSLYTGWKSSKFRSFPIIYSLYTGWKFSTDSKFSDYIPFTQDGNPRCFKVFRLYFHCKGWKSPTFRRFPIIFTFQRMEIPDDSKFSACIPYQRKEITEFYDKKDYKQ